MPSHIYNSLLERLEGRPYQTYFSCFCPFEEHKSPALLCYEDGFVCLSCHKTGTLQFLDKSIGSHFSPKQRDNTVSRVLPQWRRWEEKYGDLDGIVDTAHQSLKRYPQFQTYFKKRKINEYISEGHLGFLDGWIVFPVYNSQRQLVDIVVRSTSTKSDTRYVVAPHDSTGLRPLYCPSWTKVNEAKTVYVVYGIVDSISMYLAGLPVVTGTTGKSLNAELLRPLGKRFVIIPDKDEEKEAHVLANKLGWKAKVKELEFPDECKDPDSIRSKFGNEYLLQSIGV